MSRLKVLIADGEPESREALNRTLVELGYDVIVDETNLILPPGTTAAEAERLLIMKTLERTGNNKAEAARQLGLDVKTIRNKLRDYGTRQTQKAV